MVATTPLEMTGKALIYSTLIFVETPNLGVSTLTIPRSGGIVAI